MVQFAASGRSNTTGLRRLIKIPLSSSRRTTTGPTNARRARSCSLLAFVLGAVVLYYGYRSDDGDRYEMEPHIRTEVEVDRGGVEGGESSSTVGVDPYENNDDDDDDDFAEAEEESGEEADDDDHEGEYIVDIVDRKPADTGAYANCETEPTHIRKRDNSERARDPDFGALTAYCHRIHYMAPVQTLSSFFSHNLQRQHEHEHEPDHDRQPTVLIGVLSSASGSGPSRRQTIRETWASSPTPGSAVVFLVAGPWTAIADEYATYSDLVWIDEDEVYDGERSVLTYKTTSFLTIVHNVNHQLNDNVGNAAGYDYLFKTDDDCYLSITKLRRSLHRPPPSQPLITPPYYDYYGFCRAQRPQPLRNPNDTWSISNLTYPEPYFPRYCQGAGFALSRRFVARAAALGPGGSTIAKARYMPFEDVAVGLLAERCGMEPTMVEEVDSWKMYRGGGGREERDRVNFGGGKGGGLPTPDMRGVVLQHRVASDGDMREFHEAAMDPEGYWEIHGGEGD